MKDTLKFRGQLEIDKERGVIYFHLTNQRVIDKLQAVTLLRICGLQVPHDFKMIDISTPTNISYD